MSPSTFAKRRTRSIAAFSRSPRATPTFTLSEPLMKTLPTLLVSLLFAMQPISAESVFYLGTYTNGGASKGIYRGSLDTETGRLGPVTSVAEMKSPSYLAISPKRDVLYAVSEASHGVAAFRIGSDGSLTFLNDEATGGNGPCHVWVDATGRNVFAADYGSGSVAVFQTDPDGSLRERTDFVQFTGSGPNEGRQKGPHAHAVVTSADNRFLYACDLGTDSVWTFRLNAATGQLTPADPPAAKTPPGGGPRHIAFHPTSDFAYVNDEMTLGVTAFSRDPESGALTAIQTVPSLPEGATRERASSAEIACHPNGKWLYVSNRGHDSVAVYEIGEDGRLATLQIAPAEVKTPRGFAIDPSGRWLVVGGQDNNRIAVLAIDAETGKLTPTGQSAAVGAPVCVLFAE